MTPSRVVPRSERTVCVMGMHRSGTSFTARALQLLGVSLGSPEGLMAPGPDNPAGYWENRDIKELNDELFAQLGGAWDQPPVLDPGWSLDERLDPLRTRASEVLDDAFGAPGTRTSVIGWKDPRLSLVLPFWRTVTPITATILMVRDPAEVAASLRTRNGIETPQAAMLWLRYLFAAAANDPGHLLVRDRDFFVDLPGTLEAVSAHVDLPPPSRDTVAEAREHLDPSLRHYVSADTDPTEGNPLVALAGVVWNGGAVDLDAVPELVAEALRRGWLRPPIDGELLARARAEAVELRDRIRRRRRQERAAAQSTSPSVLESHVRSSPVSVGDMSAEQEDGDR